MEKDMIWLCQLGEVPYSKALDIQIALHQKRVLGLIPDILLLLEHPPVITIGKSGKEQNILFSDDLLEEKGISVSRVNRGGDVTYHGPGQLVGYPIFHILNYGKGVRDFVTKVEEVFIHLFHSYYQILARRDDLYTGVWVEDAKVTAMGFEIRKYISMHGFAFNVNTDLSAFRWINPCGIIGKGVTSLAQLTTREQDMQVVMKQVIESFKQVFSVQMKEMQPTLIFELAGLKR